MAVCYRLPIVTGNAFEVLNPAEMGIVLLFYGNSGNYGNNVEIIEENRYRRNRCNRLSHDSLLGIMESDLKPLVA
jgi:hypothetical protein